MEEHFRLGLRVHLVCGADRQTCGYIETIPGEFAWRGVDAPG